LGLSEADLDDVQVWPENWPVFSLFTRVQTQWRLGPGGATGLDYMVVMRLLDRMTLTDEQYDAWLDDIRLMEGEALQAMHETTDRP
jgi:hypothetical protein